ncbi:epimerase [Corynebacterium sp. CCM 9186]|uniref:NAD-dependent epimerase/dehydratase family protein n=1 Tax=Corynebacterium meridianum TaxID=2765363 RepID=UPI0020052F14|nr:NAD-dependent epimerase/dehydratase family protein [Corynebacterium meridianum]MCK7677362.1 epimerase [Corynebacterium meridianum]
MPDYLVLGAGPIGAATTTALLDSGKSVTIGTRSGTHLPGCNTVIVNAADPEALVRAAERHLGIIVCTNPRYDRWPADWPPLIESVISAAAHTGCRVVLMGNLYPYGDPLEARMCPTSPELTVEVKGKTRAEISRRLRTAASEHGFTATELRASDYFGPGAGSGAVIGTPFFRRLLSGRTCWTPGDPDAVHTWSYLPDIGASLAALAMSGDDISGQTFTGPSSGDASIRELVALCQSSSPVRRIPAPALRAAGYVSPLVRELCTVLHQHTSRYVLDDSELRTKIGVVPTPLDVALRETVTALTTG